MYVYTIHVQCCASDAINHAEVSCRVSILLKTELIDQQTGAFQHVLFCY